MKRFVIFIVLLFNFMNASSQYIPLKLEDRVTNELVEKFSKQYPEHNIELDREKGFLSNWLVWQIKLNETVWGKLIIIPEDSEMCKGKRVSYNGGIGGTGISNLESRLDFIKETSRGTKLLPDEWIGELELKYLSSTCVIDALLIGPGTDRKKLAEEVKRIDKINTGLINSVNTKDKKDFFSGLVFTIIIFSILWVMFFGFTGSKNGNSANKEDMRDNSLFYFFMYKWWTK